MRTFALPSRATLFALLPELIVACQLDAPRRLTDMHGEPFGDRVQLWTNQTLSPAQANPDFEIEFGPMSPEDRAFHLHQIQRSQRDSMLNREWRIPEDARLRLTDWSIRDQAEPYGLLCYEVPLLSVDGLRARLRGQRCESYYAEDFDFELERTHAGWTRC